MAKVQIHSVDEKERFKMVGEFFEIVNNLKTKKEIIDFFIGILSASEVLMVSRRIQVAEMILKEQSYDTIRHELNVSYQTIAKVYDWLYNGNEEMGKQIEAQMKRNLKTNKTKDFEHYESLLDKYAHHRMFKSLLK